MCVARQQAGDRSLSSGKVMMGSESEVADRRETKAAVPLAGLHQPDFEIKL